MLLGGHCSGGIRKALDNAHGFGMDAVQLFVQSPRAWRFPEHDPADLEAFRAQREELGIGALLLEAGQNGPLVITEAHDEPHKLFRAGNVHDVLNRANPDVEFLEISDRHVRFDRSRCHRNPPRWHDIRTARS